jgi:hypothetical protein
MLHFDPALLVLRSAHLAGLAANTSFQGVGAVEIDLDAPGGFNGSGYIFEAGSNVTFEVTGGSANDIIIGTSNGDDLDGEDGNDTVTGGGGADVFEPSEGQDVITDFTPGQDKFDLSDYGFDTFANRTSDDTSGNPRRLISAPIRSARRRVMPAVVARRSEEDCCQRDTEMSAMPRAIGRGNHGGTPVFVESVGCQAVAIVPIAAMVRPTAT